MSDYKEIFSYNCDIYKNAYLNWMTSSENEISNFRVLAQGYVKSVDILCESILDDNHDHKADTVIFPILFDANHAIELYLKEIVWLENILLESNQKIEGNHNIKQLVDTLKSHAKAIVNKFSYVGTVRDLNKQLTNLQDYVDEVYSTILFEDGTTDGVQKLIFHDILLQMIIKSIFT